MSAYIFGSIAALVPDAIRYLGLAKQGKIDGYFKGGTFVISLLIQVGLAVLAIYLVEPTGRVAIFGTGFAAPEILTRLAAPYLQGNQGNQPLREAGSIKAYLANLWVT